MLGERGLLLALVQVRPDSGGQADPQPRPGQLHRRQPLHGSARSEEGEPKQPLRQATRAGLRCVDGPRSGDVDGHVRHRSPDHGSHTPSVRTKPVTSWLTVNVGVVLRRRSAVWFVTQTCLASVLAPAGPTLTGLRCGRRRPMGRPLLVQGDDEVHHERGPPGLVRRAQAGARVAVEVLVERDQVAPPLVALEQLDVCRALAADRTRRAETGSPSAAARSSAI